MVCYIYMCMTWISLLSIYISYTSLLDCKAIWDIHKYIFQALASIKQIMKASSPLTLHLSSLPSKI
jgi:hypothetical protein